jgi:hypothetical protein
MKAFYSVLLCTLFTSPSYLCAQTPQASLVTGTQQDEAAIREIVHRDAIDATDPHVAADLDWENAFGIRYTDLKKRDAFYGAIVKPQMAHLTTDDTLEVKVKFIDSNVAVADEYWHIAGQVYAGETKPGPDRWGRTTFICKKENGVWTAVLERVADLRLPYYKHFDKIPAAVPVPSAILASYAGKYGRTPDRPLFTITVSGDHLVANGLGREYVVIPTSATEFLAFSPNDLAEYNKVTFTTAPDGQVSYVLAGATGDNPSPPLVRAK